MSTRSLIAAVVALRFGWVAQLAEQRTENPRVGGSIPPPATPLKAQRVQQILQQKKSARNVLGRRSRHHCRCNYPDQGIIFVVVASGVGVGGCRVCGRAI